MGELDIGSINAIEFAKPDGKTVDPQDINSSRWAAQKGIERVCGHAQPLIPA
ncbi:hypothetical protein D3C87_2095760 [compost metagenome]